MSDEALTPDVPATTTEPEAAPSADQEPAKSTPAPAPKPRAPKPKAAPAPAAEPADDPPADKPKPDPVAFAFESLQAKTSEQADLIKTLTAERDSFRRERDKFLNERDALNRQVKEGAVVGKLRGLLPSGIGDDDIYGAVARLHEQKKIDRYSDDPEKAATAALEALKASNSILLRVPTSTGGGPAGAPTQPKTATRRGPGI